MNVHVTETTVDAEGRVVLDHLPFRPGEKVEVLVRSHDDAVPPPADLRGSVLHYERPFDPVAEEDWELEQ